MEREVGGGIGMGNTCKPMAVSFQCMTKSTTILKKKKKLHEKGHIQTQELQNPGVNFSSGINSCVTGGNLFNIS